MKVRSLCLAAAAAVGMLAVHGFAQVTGKVTLEGKAPEMKVIDMGAVKECAEQHTDPVTEETVVVSDKGELKNVVVFIKTDDAASLGGEVPKEAAVLDQKSCVYTPHVLAVMVGQEMKIKNDDSFQHNVHSLATVNPAFNFSQPNKDEGKAVDSPKAAETFKVKCDVHPWMGAWVVVLEHPFFAVSGDDGSFSIPGKLADGEYNVTAWHEKYNTMDGKVTVKDGKGTVNFTFKAESADAGTRDGSAKLASSSTASKEAKMSCCETAAKK